MWGKESYQDRCFKFHRRPKGRGSQFGSGRGRGSQAYVTTTAPPVDTSNVSYTTTALTPEEISAFQKFYSKSISSHYAQSDIHPCAFNVS